jgi:BASS family bile acid:Na+ symporter
MFLLGTPEKLLVLIFLVATMLSLGMTSGIAGMGTIARERGLVLRALLANLVVVPLLGMAVARWMPVPPAAGWALILLACVPGGLSAAQFTSKIKGEESLAAAMMVLLSLGAMVVSPFLIALALPPEVELALPWGRVVALFALGVVAPLMAGMLIRSWWPAVEGRAARLVGVLGVLAFVGFMSVTKSARLEALKSIGGPAIVALGVFLAACMASGWALGGARREHRQLLATATSMRNAALGLAIARHTPGGEMVLPALVGFSLLMVPPNMILTLVATILRRRSARRPTPEAPRPGI